MEFRQLRALMKSEIKEILASEVVVETKNGVEKLENDAVIICAGGVLPNGLLKSVGVEMTTAPGGPL